MINGTQFRTFVSALATAFVAMGSFPVSATTWWVSASAGSNGNGSAGSPFQTIAAATTNPALAAGDTITIKSGTYREAVTIPALNGLTLQADTGASAVVSGLQTIPVANWVTYSGPVGTTGTVYTQTVPAVARDLYNSSNGRWNIARLPYSFQPWATVSTWSYTTGTITLTAALGITLDAPRSSFVYVYNMANKVYNAYKVASLSGNGQTIVLAGAAGTYTSGTEIKAGDLLILCNHPQLIHNTDDWAYDLPTGSTTTTNLYFFPGSSQYLSGLQYRRNNGLNTGTNRLVSATNPSNLLIKGLEILGGFDYGVWINGGSNVTVQQCVIHENGCCTALNGDGTTNGDGIMAQNVTNMSVTGCVVTANCHGIFYGSGGTGYSILKSEICYNDADGVDIGGNAASSTDTTLAVKDLDIEQCYFHHQMALEHPDNLQLYNQDRNGIVSPGVYGFTISNNVFMLSGQTVMMADLQSPSGDNTTMSYFSNNVFMSSSARALSFGHGDINNIGITNNTLCFGEEGVLGIDTQSGVTPGNLLFENNIYNGGPVLNNVAVTPFLSDYNLYWSQYYTGNYLGDCPVWFSNNCYTLASLQSKEAAKGVDGDLYSSFGNAPTPLFNNLPNIQAVTYDTQINNTVWTPSGSPSTTQVDITYALSQNLRAFAVGDYIEVNGDGVLRTVTAYTTLTSTTGQVTFTPALPTKPFRQLFLWDWGTTAPSSTAIDLGYPAGSPALTGGTGNGPRGANLSVPNYVAGKFDGSQDLPTIPSDVTVMWAHPYQYYPYFGTP